MEQEPDMHQFIAAQKAWNRYLELEGFIETKVRNTIFGNIAIPRQLSLEELGVDKDVFDGIQDVVHEINVDFGIK